MAKTRHTRPLPKAYIIIGKGISEYFYFGQFCEYEKELLYKKKITIKPAKPKHVGSRDIINKAESYLEKEYDEVFCLINLDYIFHETKHLLAYSKIKRSYEQKHKNRIHFTESNHYLSTCEEIISKLRKKDRSKLYAKFHT